MEKKTKDKHPRVIVVGGGFAGLAAAKALAAAPVEIMVVDRRNHHVFQPLLYQVATASLSPADISAPIRTILRSQRNCQVAMAEVTGVDLNKRRLLFGKEFLNYDYLILACGATHAYFGHDEWERIAPGLKSIEDATEMRRRILLAFESAELEGDEAARTRALTFGVVGGGPTGVELAGAIKEIAGRTIPKDYRHIDTRTTHVMLFEAGERLLPQFSPELSGRAHRDLENMGVDVRLNAKVTDISPRAIHVDKETIPVRNVFWTAGVRACSLTKSLGVSLDRAGRLIVGPDLSIPGQPGVFAVGDTAAAKSADTGKPVPGLAQPAIQMGRYVGAMIAREVDAHGNAAGESAMRRPFVYRDKGIMAVIGKAKAVVEIGRFKCGGFFAWMLWGSVHILFLIGFRNRLQVLLIWFWNWLLNARDARLIAGKATIDVHTPRPTEFNQDDDASG
jgi:NADH dehydrogenase